MFDVLPELSDLEADTLDALLAQAQQHAKYERAARDLVQREKNKLEEIHEQNLRSLRAEADSNATRTAVSSEMKLKAQTEEVRRPRASDSRL